MVIPKAVGIWFVLAVVAVAGGERSLEITHSILLEDSLCASITQ